MTTTLNYNNSIYQTSYSDYYNGVVMVGNGTNAGTGALLYDGRSVLTAAHIFEPSDNNSRVNVYVQTQFGLETIHGTLKLYEDYDDKNLVGDLAIITLDKNLDNIYNRYQLYRDQNELNQDFTMVGYGNLGTGTDGEGTNDLNKKIKVKNTFEVDMIDVYNSPYTNLTWIPQKDTTIAADFDSGSSSNDSFASLFNYNHTGLGDMEGNITGGDSGGPAFIGNEIAGVASYGMRLNNLNNTDINDTVDGSFGEIAVWQRVSHYAQWLDKQIRKNYKDAPNSIKDVKTEVTETDNEIVYTYFLLEYTQDRSLIEDNITLSYTTKNGTAIAGEDYIATSGTITLYSNEYQVAIPVEVLADDIEEDNEYFYLEVSSPSHGSFGTGKDVLTATRTIIDDDIAFIA